MRLLAISDIHGCVEQLDRLLNKVSYNPKQDQLILLGDYVDRGLKSKQTIDRIIELQKEGAITLRGNHDEMMFTSLKLHNDDDHMSAIWLNNGAFQTLESYVGFDFFEEGFSWGRYTEAKRFILENHLDHMKFLENLLPYYETEHYIFVHAGFLPPLSKNPLDKQMLDDFLWIREEFQQFPTGTEKMVIFGHTPTGLLHRDKNLKSPWIDPIHLDKIGIDGACCFSGGQLNCLIMCGREITHTFVQR